MRLFCNSWLLAPEFCLHQHVWPTELDAGKLGKLKVINGSQILLGPPIVFTKDNIDKYDF